LKTSPLDRVVAEIVASPAVDREPELAGNTLVVVVD
jgi:hypothetical protein